MSKMISSVRHTWEKNWPDIHAAARGSLPSFILSRAPDGLGEDVPVFCYHVVSEEEFESDMRFLCSNDYVTIDSDSLLNHVEGREPAPEKSIVISVDDGARNLRDVIFPLLKKYNMKAVAFVAPRFHEDPVGDKGAAQDICELPLDWAQLREMEDSGLVDIQSHSFEHRYVPRWPEPLELLGSNSEAVDSLRGPVMSLEQDFRMAKEVLEDKLQKKINHLAFPKFNGTDEAIQIGKRLGYKGFWWGVRADRAGNQPGLGASHIVRVDGMYVQRLPGHERKPLSEVLSKRYAGSLSRLLRNIKNKD